MQARVPCTPTARRRINGLSAGLLFVAAALAPVSLPAAPAAVPCLTEAVSDVEMSSAVAGIVSAIHHGEGEFVAQGAIVLELESRVEQLDVERRQIQVETLAAELARSENLLRTTSSISREEVEKKRGEHRIAAVELQIAREALARRRVAAPFAGVVTLLPIRVGEYCQPPRVLLRLVDARSFHAIANIDPATARGLAMGTAVSFENGSETGGRLEGRIVFISPVVDPASGLLRVKALFANPGGRLRPGVAGRLHLP